MGHHRRIQHRDEQLIEAGLVIERAAELGLGAGWNDMGRHLLGNPAISAVTSGLTAVLGAGLSVDLSAGSVLLAQGDDYLHVIEESVQNVVLDPADPTNSRYDIIQAEIKIRGAYADTSEELLDAEAGTIAPVAVERDWEYYLLATSVTGVPSVTPVPSPPFSGTRGKVTGSVTTDVLDCSVNRYLRLTFSREGEFQVVDVAGAIPATTTLAERIAAINAAFVTYGTIAFDDGGALQLKDLTVGFNSRVKLRQPLDPNTDALGLILGLTETSSYYYEYRGSNAAVKLAEIYVEAGATVLGAEDVIGMSDKADWQTTDLNVLLPSFQQHRTADPIDHPDESIGLTKLKPEVKSGITSKLTTLRGPYAVLYPVPGDPTSGKLATLLLRDVECYTLLGNSQNREDQEQEFPVSRVDQEQSDVSGPDYICQISLSEGGINEFAFIPSPDYFFTNNFHRFGVYINSIGSGYTHLRFVLHNSGHVQQSAADIPIGDLATGWFYAEFPAPVITSASYHVHCHVVGFTAGATTRLATATGGLQVSFRELYLPAPGKFGSASTSDVVHLLNPDGTEIVSVRLSGDDDIVSPGDGFIGSSGYDLMAANLSNQTFWENAAHREFILIDLANGRIKLPAALAFGTVPDPISAEYNIQEGQDLFDARNVLMHRYGASIEDAIRWDWDPENNAIRTDQHVGVNGDPGAFNLNVAGTVNVSGITNINGNLTNNGLPFTGTRDDGVPIRTKTVTLSLNNGISAGNVAHGIPNAASLNRIIRLNIISNTGSNSNYMADSSGNPSSLELFVRYVTITDTSILLVRQGTSGTTQFVITIDYV